MSASDNRNGGLINEIMSGGRNPAIVLCEPNAARGEFVADLSRNYSRTFRIDCATDADSGLARAAAEKAFADDPPQSETLERFGLCSLDEDVDLALVPAIVDWIGRAKDNCLMVFERAEASESRGDCLALERLMIGCPSNLKIVVVSDAQPAFDLRAFDGAAPKLYRMPRESRAALDESALCADLSQSDRAFLRDCSLVSELDVALVSDFRSDGIELLRGLAERCPGAVAFDGKTRYSVSERLARALEKTFPVRIAPDRAFLDAALRPLVEKGGAGVAKALRICLEARDSAGLNDIVKACVADPRLFCRVLAFARRTGRAKLEFVSREHPHSALFRILTGAARDADCSKAASECKALIDAFEPGSRARFLLSAVLAHSLCKSGDAAGCAGIAAERLADASFESAAPIACALGLCSADLGEELCDSFVSAFAEFESGLDSERAARDVRQCVLRKAFFRARHCASDYSAAIRHMSELRKLVPFYPAPARYFAARFFLGDVADAESGVEAAMADPVGLRGPDDISIAHILSALIRMYYAECDRAVESLDVALCDSGPVSDRIRAISIALRAMVCSDAGRTEYAKDICLLWLERYESRKSAHLGIFECAASYLHRRAGEPEAAAAFARRALRSCDSGSWFRLIPLAILMNDHLAEGDSERNRERAARFMRECRNRDADLAFVLWDSLFMPVLDYAFGVGLCANRISEIRAKVARRKACIRAAKPLTVKFFGNCVAKFNGVPIAWKTRKAKELFLMYVLRGEEGITRDEIIRQFWNGYVYASALNNLKTTNNIIRNALKSCGAEFALDYFDSKYVLRIDVCDTDLSRLDALLAKARSENDLVLRSGLIRKLVQIYGDGFAKDMRGAFFAEYDEVLRGMLIDETARLARDCEEAGDEFEVRSMAKFLDRLSRGEDRSHHLS